MRYASWKTVALTSLKSVLNNILCLTKFQHSLKLFFNMKTIFIRPRFLLGICFTVLSRARTRCKLSLMNTDLTRVSGSTWTSRGTRAMFSWPWTTSTKLDRPMVEIRRVGTTLYSCILGAKKCSMLPKDTSTRGSKDACKVWLCYRKPFHSQNLLILVFSSHCQY